VVSYSEPGAATREQESRPAWTVADWEETPLLAPLTPSLNWSTVHSLCQTPWRAAEEATEAPTVSLIRRSATIRCGTRMIRLLSPRQFLRYLRGRLPSGFCYRAVDIAHLRTPAEIAMLTGDISEHDQARNPIVFGLRWRAVDPADYEIPFSTSVAGLPAYPGLVAISPQLRVGPAVIGTGFAPSRHHLIPEFVTADLCDLPTPANASLVAFAPDGTEVTMYLYVAELRSWTRMVGPQWRHLLDGVGTIPLDQEHVALAPPADGGSTLVGHYRGTLYDAVADPPHEYRVLSKARAARYQVETLARLTRYGVWRDVECTVVRRDHDHLLLRLRRPDPENVVELGAHCVERGVYEVWAPTAEVRDLRVVRTTYDISRAPAEK
jgi:hypothetical protein